MKRRSRNSLLAVAGITVALAATACSTAPSEPGTVDHLPTAVSVCHTAVEQKLSAQPGNSQFSQEQTKPTSFGIAVSGAITTGEGTSRYMCSAEQNGSDWVAARVAVNS
jgi:hypothetical protein